MGNIEVVYKYHVFNSHNNTVRPFLILFPSSCVSVRKLRRVRHLPTSKCGAGVCARSV